MLGDPDAELNRRACMNKWRTIHVVMQANSSGGGYGIFHDDDRGIQWLTEPWAALCSKRQVPTEQSGRDSTGKNDLYLGTYLRTQFV